MEQKVQSRAKELSTRPVLAAGRPKVQEAIDAVKESRKREKARARRDGRLIKLIDDVANFMAQARSSGSCQSVRVTR